MTIKNFGFLALPAILCLMSSCLSNNDEYEDYAKWRTRNIEYLDSIEKVSLDGIKAYEKVVPAWDPASYVYMRWHNDRDMTASALSPLSNSTCDVVYLLRNIDGDTLDSSYSQTYYGDSIYRCPPNQMITGFQIAMMNMHVGDSVTAVVPYTSAYGVTGSGSVLPYSTLVFSIKLAGIPGFETNH